MSGGETMRARLHDRRWLATRLGVPAAVIAVAVPLGLAATGGSEPSASEGAGPTATAAVTSRDLVDRETFRGTLGYADPRTVSAGLQGTVTHVADEGAIRDRGEVLYRVDEQPVVLMYGRTPVYRPMGEGDDGGDVRQLERNLVELGFGADDIEVDGEFDSTTAAAVRDWQEALGVDETGRVELGQVVFLDGRRRVGVVQGTVGSSARPGQPVMETTSTARTVTVELDARRQDLVAEGDTEKVTLPGGDAVDARVTEVGTVAKAANPEADPTITVTMTLTTTRGVTALDEAPVDVDISTERADDALSVPVTALLALDGGGFGVEIAGSAGDNRIVAVTIGLFADGFVEVSGEGIVAGTEVVVPA